MLCVRAVTENSRKELFHTQVPSGADPLHVFDAPEHGGPDPHRQVPETQLFAVPVPSRAQALFEKQHLPIWQSWVPIHCGWTPHLHSPFKQASEVTELQRSFPPHLQAPVFKDRVRSIQIDVFDDFLHTARSEILILLE